MYTAGVYRCSGWGFVLESVCEADLEQREPAAVQWSQRPMELIGGLAETADAAMATADTATGRTAPAPTIRGRAMCACGATCAAPSAGATRFLARSS